MPGAGPASEDTAHKYITEVNLMVDGWEDTLNNQPAWYSPNFHPNIKEQKQFKFKVDLSWSDIW